MYLLVYSWLNQCWKRFLCVIHYTNTANYFNLTHTNIVSVYHYMNAVENYAYAPRSSCYGFPNENIKNTRLQCMRFP